MAKGDYYAKSLNARKLFDVYQTKHKRVKQYLNAEIDFVKNNLIATEQVLELGAGYGRIVKELAPHCREIIGIDISEDNVMFGKEYLQNIKNANLIAMNAHNIKFDCSFDAVLCLQNGLSAMRIEPISYIKQLVNIVKQGGRVFISTYSPKFWEYRLLWFQEQADKGLLGEIDMEKTKNGVIICKDGFRATTHSYDELNAIGEASGFGYEVTEVDDSSIFLVINKV
ncbi:MAG: class I SAM-dependent methyltransferase [Clostridiales bacterium]|nr:class I SAM-dependent methyltransferase [Clostridiales bacterium]